MICNNVVGQKESMPSLNGNYLVNCLSLNVLSINLYNAKMLETNDNADILTDIIKMIFKLFCCRCFRSGDPLL